MPREPMKPMMTRTLWNSMSPRDQRAHHKAQQAEQRAAKRTARVEAAQVEAVKDQTLVGSAVSDSGPNVDWALAASLLASPAPTPGIGDGLTPALGEGIDLRGFDPKSVGLVKGLFPRDPLTDGAEGEEDLAKFALSFDLQGVSSDSERSLWAAMDTAPHS